MELPRAPLDGVRVVEVSLGVSVVGAGMAASLPGSLLRDLGAEVARVESAQRSTLDSGVEYQRVWDRGKEVVAVADDDAADAVAALARDADVVFLCGPETAIERQGLGVSDLARANPRLIGVRVRPSFNAKGGLPDLELLVAARAGLTTQIRGHDAGRPVFPTLAVGQAGAAVSATVGALAGLFQRERSGVGAWAETSLYEGMMALLPMIVGRVEHHSPTTRLLWEQQGPAETLCYRCADGGYLQLWFGAKGAYEAFLGHMGEPPSEQGYNADLMSGAMVERGRRWAVRFAAHDRGWWLEDLAGRDFRCEPVLGPGEALRDAHVRDVGLAAAQDDPGRGPITGLGPVVRVVPVGDGDGTGRDAEGPWLSDVRVLDLSAYLAGPIAPLVLAELGADVVKVEPVTGDVHRNMEPMYAAGQRGKRALALDLKAPDAAAVLSRLFQWSDVVHHNSRVGLAERLGYDEATVRAANPGVVYSFASGWGENGPRALLPLNDQLMQAFSGVEYAQGGSGQPPTYLVWGAVDVTGGWIAACGVLAGLFARRRTGSGQRVSSSLLAAGLFLESGPFLTGERVVTGPVLDSGQRGYGAAYRLYEGADGGWLALAVPDAAAWRRLRDLLGDDDLAAEPPPLRTQSGETQPAELVLERAFSTKDASTWVSELRRAGVPAELAVEVDRTGFSAGFLDDPVNHQLGRVLSYRWGDRGTVEQPGFGPRVGPLARPRAGAHIAKLGEHTDEVLEEVGFDAASRRGWRPRGPSRRPRRGSTRGGLGDGPGGEERLDLVGVDPPRGEDLACVLAGDDGGPGRTRRRPAEARRRRRLHDSVERDERSPGDVVWMFRRFGHGEHGREARVGALEEVAPLAQRLLLEGRREKISAVGPRVPVALSGHERLVDPDALQELPVELRLAGADRDVPTVGRLVDVVLRCSEVEDVGLRFVRPQVLGAQPVEEGRQERDPVHHGGIDDLTQAGARPLEQRAHDADQQQHAAPAVVAEQVQRRHRRLIAPAQMVERAGEGDIVDVVPGCGRVGTFPSPAGDPGVDEAGVAIEADVGAEAEPLGDAGPAAFHEHVGPVDQLERHRQAVGMGQVDGGRPLSPGDEVDPASALEHPGHRRLVGVRSHVPHPTDGDDVSTEVGEQHGGEGARSPAVQFDNLQPGQRSLHVTDPLCAHRAGRTISWNIDGSSSGAMR